MASALAWIIRRDLVLALRQRTDVMTTLIFFVIVVSLFPLGVGPEMDKLRPLAPGVLWVAALLASMTALRRRPCRRRSRLRLATARRKYKT